MYITQPLFDLIAAREAAEIGIAQAAANKPGLLAFAKDIAAEIGRKQRFVTADDVQFELNRRSVSEEALGNAAGSLFKGKVWRFTGRFVPCQRENSHGRMLRVWEYVG